MSMLKPDRLIGIDLGTLGNGTTFRGRRAKPTLALTSVTECPKTGYIIWVTDGGTIVGTEQDFIPCESFNIIGIMVADYQNQEIWRSPVPVPIVVQRGIKTEINSQWSVNLALVS